MMKNFSILSFLIVLSLSSFSQQKYTISGFINDKENGESLIGVNVLVKEKLVGTTSNTYGFYSLTLPEDTYEVSFTYIGFETQTKSINLNKNVMVCHHFIRCVSARLPYSPASTPPGFKTGVLLCTAQKQISQCRYPALVSALPATFKIRPNCN